MSSACALASMPSNISRGPRLHRPPHPLPGSPLLRRSFRFLLVCWTPRGLDLLLAVFRRRQRYPSLYVMHWWESMSGTGGEYRGRFDGDTLMLGAPMPQGGQSRASWTLTAPDAHVFLMEVSPDGETWHPAMEGRYRKSAPPPSASRPAARKAKAVRKAVKKAVSKKAPARIAPGKKAPARKAPPRRSSGRQAAKQSGRKTTRR